MVQVAVGRVAGPASQRLREYLCLPAIGNMSTEVGVPSSCVQRQRDAVSVRVLMLANRPIQDIQVILPI